MEPWLLEFADEQAMKWNGYFSIADMYDMLKERCEEQGCDLDFSASTVGREMRLRGWKKHKQRIKPRLDANQMKKRVEFCKQLLDRLESSGGWLDTKHRGRTRWRMLTWMRRWASLPLRCLGFRV